MEIIVVGLGSMGKRRIRLLLNHFKNLTVIGIDSKENRRISCKEIYQIDVYESIDDAKKVHQIDCAFVCTSPLSHNLIIRECLNNHFHVFTELNLVQDGYDDNIALAENLGKTLFLSSTALYRKEMKYIIEYMKNAKEEINYSYHVGQYLPDWHPWETIHDYFVSNSKTNGCREIMAIELPWIIEAFGRVKDLKVVSSKMSNLDINYHDNYMILLQHENNSKGVFMIDVVSREAIRDFKAYSETFNITWEGQPNTLRVKDIQSKEWKAVTLYDKIDKLNDYSSNIIENQYLDEIREFFDVVNGRKGIKYGFSDDKYTLDLIDTIENSDKWK